MTEVQKCPPHSYELRQTTGKQTCIRCYEEMPWPDETQSEWLNELASRFAFYILADSYLCTSADRIFKRFNRAVKEIGPLPSTKVSQKARELLDVMKGWDYQNGNPDSSEFDREMLALQRAIEAETGSKLYVLYEDLKPNDCATSTHGQRFIVVTNGMRQGGRLVVLYEDSKPWYYGPAFLGETCRQFLGQGSMTSDTITWPDGKQTAIRNPFEGDFNDE